jgi:hypothetical protein
VTRIEGGRQKRTVGPESAETTGEVGADPLPLVVDIHEPLEDPGPPRRGPRLAAGSRLRCLPVSPPTGCTRSQPKGEDPGDTWVFSMLWPAAAGGDSGYSATTVKVPSIPASKCVSMAHIT